MDTPIDKARSPVQPEIAFRLALRSILWNHRLADLRELVTDGHDTGGLEGDPGWILERRDENATHPALSTWPQWARFRAFVDPAEFHLQQPECFLDRAGFADLARPLLREYLEARPDKEELVKDILASL
jgi:hypothetical protein